MATSVFPPWDTDGDGETDFPRNCFVIQGKIQSDRVVVVFIFLSVDRKIFLASLQIKTLVEREILLNA